MSTAVESHAPRSAVVIPLLTRSVEETRTVAGRVAMLARPGDVFLLTGDLGAGKTAFVQGFAASLGVDEPVTSPTFALVQHYDAAGTALNHVDAYRLDDPAEILDLGLDEILDTTVTLVEWADRIRPVLPPDALAVDLALGDGPDDRTVTLRPEGRWEARVSALSSAVAPWCTEPGDAG